MISYNIMFKSNGNYSKTHDLKKKDDKKDLTMLELFFQGQRRKPFFTELCLKI